MLRPLRVLRVFSAGQTLFSRGARLPLARTLQAVAAAASILVFISALAILDAERGKAGANIGSFGDALWWAGATVTTVGYGDRFPVTGTGRLVAFALMLVGISLLGIITASVAAWFVSRTAEASDEETESLDARLDRVEAQLTEITRLLEGESSGEKRPR
jgi:voltage-gated potassium channel